MLVGLQTNPDESGNLKWPGWLNRGLDMDVVSEMRETSGEPDEVHRVIGRTCPGGRKLGMSSYRFSPPSDQTLSSYFHFGATEIFGRKHDTRPGWLTLGISSAKIRSNTGPVRTAQLLSWSDYC